VRPSRSRRESDDQQSAPRNGDRRSDKENVVVASHARQPANRTQSPPHTLDRRRTEHPFGAALTASQQIKTSARIGGSARDYPAGFAWSAA
jgi:hypothetical protein